MKKIKIMFVVVLVLAVLGGVSAIRAAGEKKIPANDVCDTYVVQAGDTLWSIAREQMSGYDCTGEAVHVLRKVNGMKDSTIYVGDVIMVPEEKGGDKEDV